MSWLNSEPAEPEESKQPQPRPLNSSIMSSGRNGPKLNESIGANSLRPDPPLQQRTANNFDMSGVPQKLLDPGLSDRRSHHSKRRDDKQYLSVQQTQVLNDEIRKGSALGQRPPRVTKVDRSAISLNLVDSEESLIFSLQLILSEIENQQFSGPRRRAFLTYLKQVDFHSITMLQSTWSNLITVLRHIVTSSENEADSDQALQSFADIMAMRQFDTSTVMTLLTPAKDGESESELESDDEEDASVEGPKARQKKPKQATNPNYGAGMDILANLGTNKATNMFALKFLLCGQSNSASGGGQASPTSKKKETDGEQGDSIKSYAMTSYLKLLTARILKLEQEMSRHKKVSVVMVGGTKEDNAEPAAAAGAYGVETEANGQKSPFNEDADKPGVSPRSKKTSVGANVIDQVNAIMEMQTGKLQKLVSEHSLQISQLQDRVQTEAASSHHQIEQVKEKYEGITAMYADMERLTKEMRNGRSMRVEQDLENRKMVVEIDNKVQQLRYDFELQSKNNRTEITRTADTLRLDVCNFIEQTRTLIEKVSEKLKQLQQVVGVIQNEKETQIKDRVSSAQRRSAQRRASELPELQTPARGERPTQLLASLAQQQADMIESKLSSARRKPLYLQSPSVQGPGYTPTITLENDGGMSQRYQSNIRQRQGSNQAQGGTLQL